jgi:hypothetical protein
VFLLPVVIVPHVVLLYLTFLPDYCAFSPRCRQGFATAHSVSGSHWLTVGRRAGVCNLQEEWWVWRSPDFISIWMHDDTCLHYHQQLLKISPRYAWWFNTKPVLGNSGTTPVFRRHGMSFWDKRLFDLLRRQGQEVTYTPTRNVDSQRLDLLQALGYKNLVEKAPFPNSFRCSWSLHASKKFCFGGILRKTCIASSAQQWMNGGWTLGSHTSSNQRSSTASPLPFIDSDSGTVPKYIGMCLS